MEEELLMKSVWTWKKWFKTTNPDWQDVRGKKETFLYEEPWISLLEEIENSPNTGHPFYALYPDSPIISKLVPEYLIPKVHDLGETREMMEIARFSRGNVIPTGKLEAFFEDEWVVVRGLVPIKKR